MGEHTEKRLVALVTGAGRGIGLACARELASLGFDVCLNCSGDHSLARTQEQAELISQEFGVNAVALAADVSDFEAANTLIKETIAHLGSLDVLVNNAGITRDGLIMRMSEEDFDSVIDINLKGTFNCCKAASRPMTKQRAGRIINMSSVVGVYGNAGQVNYAASKAGVIGLTKALSKELAARNITVNAIAPGFIQTDMTNALTSEQQESIAANIGLGRLGEPADIAALVGFFASPQAGYITGQVVCVDGGLSL